MKPLTGSHCMGVHDDKQKEYHLDLNNLVKQVHLYTVRNKESRHTMRKNLVGVSFNMLKPITCFWMLKGTDKRCYFWNQTSGHVHKLIVWMWSIRFYWASRMIATPVFSLYMPKQWFTCQSVDLKLKTLFQIWTDKNMEKCSVLSYLIMWFVY